MKPGRYTGGSAGENNPALRSSTSPGDFACWRTWRLLAAVGLPSPFRNTRCKASYEGKWSVPRWTRAWLAKGSLSAYSRFLYLQFAKCGTMGELQ